MAQHKFYSIGLGPFMLQDKICETKNVDGKPRQVHEPETKHA